jgi:ribosomal protein S27E
MADVSTALISAGFVETVFHCPGCGTSGTSLSRPQALLDRACLACGEPLVTSVLDRFHSEV